MKNSPKGTKTTIQVKFSDSNSLRQIMSYYISYAVT